MALLGLTSLYRFFNNEQDDLTTLNNSAVTYLEAEILNAEVFSLISHKLTTNHETRPARDKWINPES